MARAAARGVAGDRPLRATGRSRRRYPGRARTGLLRLHQSISGLAKGSPSISIRRCRHSYAEAGVDLRIEERHRALASIEPREHRSHLRQQFPRTPRGPKKSTFCFQRSLAFDVLKPAGRLILIQPNLSTGALRTTSTTRPIRTIFDDTNIGEWLARHRTAARCRLVPGLLALLDERAACRSPAHPDLALPDFTRPKPLAAPDVRRCGEGLIMWCGKQRLPDPSDLQREGLHSRLGPGISTRPASSTRSSW